MTGDVERTTPVPEPESEPIPVQQPERMPRSSPDQPAHPPPSNDPLAFLTSAPLGTRVVVRTRIPGGFSDALGYLRARDETGCTIEARRGLVTMVFADLVAAKEVPPPPERRVPRRQDSPTGTDPSTS